MAVPLVLSGGATPASGNAADASLASRSLTASALSTARLGFDPEDFDDPTTIDNPWLPLRPGMQYHFSGSALDGGVRLAHDTVFTVTDLTKVVAGVRTVVVWDQDYTDGELSESELVVFAQDNAGNVWHFGQYREEYDGPELTGGQAWFPGALRGAKAGIMMPAHPRPGTPAFSEGFAPAPYFWEDYGRVTKAGLKTCVPAGCYDGVIVVEEFEPSKPNAFQLKYVARGVGYVRVGWRGSADDSKENLALTRIKRLDARAMTAVRAAVRALDDRATVYSRTGPLR